MMSTAEIDGLINYGRTATKNSSSNVNALINRLISILDNSGFVGFENVYRRVKL